MPNKTKRNEFLITCASLLLLSCSLCLCLSLSALAASAEDSPPACEPGLEPGLPVGVATVAGAGLGDEADADEDWLAGWEPVAPSMARRACAKQKLAVSSIIKYNYKVK